MPLADVGGHKIYYESHGQGFGPPLLLIMGLGGSCKGWLPLQVPEPRYFRKRRFIEGSRSSLSSSSGI